MSTRRTILTALPALPAMAALATEARADVSCKSTFKGITRERYDQYIALYNANDPAFAQFYQDNVVMETTPPLTSARAIVDFSRELRTYVTEHITVEYYVAGDTGSAAQFLGEFHCVRDMPLTAMSGLFGKAVKKGQVLKQRGIILYGVKDSKFTFIRAAPPIIVQDWS